MTKETVGNSKIVSLTDEFADETTAIGEWGDAKLPGFRFKVTPGGKKVWFVENLLHGTRKTITLTIGRYPAVKHKEARKTAHELLAQLRQGVDPRLEKKRQQKIQEAEWAAEKRVQQLTLSAVLADYLGRKNLKPGSVDNYRIVANAYLADWMSRSLTEITKDDVENRFNQITNGEVGGRKGGPGAANNTMRVLRALFTFAQEMYEMPDGTPVVLLNPVKRLNQLNSWNKLKRRQTMLSEMDLPLWYQAVCTLKDEVMADYFVFVLLTGLRKNEAAHLKWDDVHVKRGYFEIVDTKNKLEFALPITVRIKEIFDRRSKARTDKTNPYVFPGPGKKTGRLDLRDYHFNLVYQHTKVPFGLHDLRRTYLTQGFLMGHDLEMLKKLANHKSNDSEDVTKGYLIVKVADMKEPMEKVGDRLWDMMTRKTKRKIAAG